MLGFRYRRWPVFWGSDQSPLILIRCLRILVIILNSVIIGMVEDTQVTERRPRVYTLDFLF